MATLQAGQTVSIQLAEGESYTVTPSGTAQVSTRGVSGSELSAPRTLTSAQTFGPYTEAGAISIACLSGTVDYTQAGGPVYQDLATGALACAWSGPWAARPALGTVPAKTRIFVTDIPSGIGSVFIAGATTWLPEAGEVVLAQSNVPGTPVTGTTAPVTQPLVTVPGGLLGANGMLILEGTFSYTNNANNKTSQLRFENSGSPVRVFSVTQASTPAHSFVAYLWNRGADNAQSFHYNLAAGIGAGGTFDQSSMNTAVDQTLNALLMLANAADTMSLERWAVRARPF